MTLTIDLSKELEAALKTRALAQGTDAAGYARQVLERALGMEEPQPGPPLKTGRGLLAKYGPAPSAEEIDANRADMFRGFGENAP
jgi:plasmid stability protein